MPKGSTHMIIHQKALKFLVTEFIIVVICVFCGTVALFGAYSLPLQRIQDNVTQSVDTFLKEGSYPRFSSENLDSQLDNWTDAIMILVSAGGDSNNIVRSAMLNIYPMVEGLDPVESLVEIYGGAAKSHYTNVEYGRYWHGYVVFLKPLLLFFNYDDIRYLIMILHVTLLALIFTLLGKRRQSLYAIPLVLAYLFCNPLALMQSMQFSTITLLALIQLVFFLLLRNKYEKYPVAVVVHFTVFGCLTSYIDLLTFPLVALFIPLAYFVCTTNTARSFRSCLLQPFLYTICWGIGYGGMWMSKWFIGTLLTGKNIVANALEQAAYRTSYAVSSGAVGQDIQFTFLDMIETICGVPNHIFLVVFLISILLFLSSICVLTISKKFNPISCLRFRQSYYLFLCLFGIALSPFFWYALLSEHSYWHAFFTYRELCISIYCIVVCFVVVFDNARNVPTCNLVK